MLNLLRWGAVLAMGSMMVGAESLKEALDHRAAESAKRVPAPAREVMAEAAKELAESKMLEGARNVGEQAVDFTLTDQDGEEVVLSELWAEGPVVLVWYRGGWCPYCNLTLAHWQDSLAELEDLGARLVAISPEKPDERMKTVGKNELGFTVVSDTDNGVARQYGLVFELPEDLVEVYADFGINVREHNGAQKHELPLAATYLVAPGGAILWRHVETDYRQRAEPAEVLKALRRVREGADGEGAEGTADDAEKEDQ